MASPFSIFRKHQKLWYAVLGLMAMIAFVLLPIIMQSMETRRVENPVVVHTTKYGDLDEMTLRNMLDQRRRVHATLESLRQQVTGDPNEARRTIEANFGTPDEATTVDYWLLAQRAQRQGMAITDKMIVSFLKELTQDRVKSDEIQKIFKQHGFSEYGFLQAFRSELLAYWQRRLFNLTRQIFTPAQRWDYLTRLKRQATIELVPVAVEKFTDQVPDPDETTLQKFFDEHKETYAWPDSPEPGFREPKKVNVCYFKAEYDKVLASITDEDIKQQYEKNKDEYDRWVAAQEKTEKAAAEKSPTEKPAGEQPPAEKATGEKPAAEAPAGEKGPVEKPAEKPKAEAGAPPAAAEKAPSTPDKAQPNPAGKGAAAPSKPTSANGAASPFRLVALQSEKTDAGQPGGAAASTASGDKPAATAAAKSDADKEKPKAGEQAKAGEKAAEGETKQEETKPGEAPAGEEKPKAKLTPLDRLHEQIRGELAREKIQKAFAHLQQLMSQFQSKWSRYQADLANPAKKATAKAPTPLDFDALAAEDHLTAGETGVIPQVQAIRLDIGKSFVDAQRGFLDTVYDNLPLYLPKSSVDWAGNAYLFWKVAEAKERVPNFDDKGIRREVLREWKMIKARELAQKEAERLADEAKKAQQPLKEVFAGQDNLRVISAGPFSWMTFGSVSATSQMPPRISQVEGVEYPGDEFMRAVFDLKPGEVGTAMNKPKTTAYVVRMVDVTPSDNVLWVQFESDPFDKYGAVAVQDEVGMTRAWFEELRTSAGLKWLRPPDRPAETPAGPADTTSEE